MGAVMAVMDRAENIEIFLREDELIKRVKGEYSENIENEEKEDAVIKKAVELSTIRYLRNRDSDDVKRAAKFIIVQQSRFKWTRQGKAKMRKLLPNIGDLLPLGIYFDHRIRTVHSHLMTRSHVQILCETFPELAECILYSPQLEEIDNVIDSFRIDSPFHSYGDYAFVTGGYKVFPNHQWWNLADSDDITIGGLSLDEAERIHNKRHERGGNI